MAMTYCDVPSGIRFQAGETVSVLAVLEATVRVWPAPAPALMLTVRPAHWLSVQALAPFLSRSSSFVLVCMMTYPVEASSGIVVHAGETVSVLASLDTTVRVWPAPNPALVLTRRPAHWPAVHAEVPNLVVSLSVVLVWPGPAALELAVPASPLPVPLSPGRSVASSANTVPPAAVAAPKSVEPLSVTLKIPFSPPRVVLVKGPQKRSEEHTSEL